MIEVFPKKINLERAKANYERMMTAFLIVAKDLNREMYDDHIENREVLTVSGPVFSKNTGKI